MLDLSESDSDDEAVPKAKAATAAPDESADDQPSGAHGGMPLLCCVLALPSALHFCAQLEVPDV